MLAVSICGFLVCCAFATRPGGSEAEGIEADEGQATEAEPIVSVFPKAWACLGPFEDPKAVFAFGGIRAIARRAPESLWRTLREAAANESALVLRENITALNLETFPSETGTKGRSGWGVAFSTGTEASRLSLLYSAGEYGRGWAVGEFELKEETTLLAQCDTAFSLDSFEAESMEDYYNEHRAVTVLHLSAGWHRMYVESQSSSFSCHLLVDSASARLSVTQITDVSNGLSPFIVLQDMKASDVVAGSLVSPHFGTPLLNTGKKALRLSAAEVQAPSQLRVRHFDTKMVAPGQTLILQVELQQTSTLTCEHMQNGNQAMNITIVFYPEGDLPSQQASLQVACHPNASSGYLVAYPDFDGSIQRMWVAPPNLTRFEHKSCPSSGCPVVLSLHGASIDEGPGWGRSYEYDGLHAHRTGFPLPAWLVQPTNRWKWGTDWEGPGLDNALYSLRYVKQFLPGAPEEGDLEQKRELYRMDSDRVFITGHSMGGHGCFVFATHFPDLLLGAMCGAAWGSMRRYGNDRQPAEFLDRTDSGLLTATMDEHNAYFASANLKGIPMRIVYGNRDENVPISEPRHMARLLDSVSNDTTIVEVKELPGVPHWFNQQIPEVMEFIESKLAPPSSGSLPMPGLPEEFEFEATSPWNFGSRGSLRILQQHDASRPARFFVERCSPKQHDVDASSGSSECNTAQKELVQAKSARGLSDLAKGLFKSSSTSSQLDPHGVDTASREEDPVWIVNTFNVRRLSISRPMPGRQYPRALRVDGHLFSTKQLAQTSCTHLCQLDKDWKLCGLRSDDCEWDRTERGGRNRGTGPIQMALRNAPICIAHGSGSGQRSHAVQLANKMYFISRYAPLIIDASSSTRNVNAIDLPHECANANLILIGPPSENSWTAFYRCSFASYVRFSTDLAGGRGFVLNGHGYAASGTGLLAIGGLPSGRTALLVHGIDDHGLEQAAQKIPIRSGGHSADFLVFGPDYGWKGEGGLLAGGFLDAHWRVSSAAWSEPEHFGFALFNTSAVEEFYSQCPPELPMWPDPWKITMKLVCGSCLFLLVMHCLSQKARSKL